MNCRYCSKPFFKSEHLSRHERSHTGIRPFVCPKCRRPFARQDSLARHQRLHKHNKDAADNLLLGQPPQQSLPSPLPSRESRAPIGSNVQDDSWEDQAAYTGSTVREITQSAFLDFDLIWPDSEHLFESLMALESTAPTQLPLEIPSVGNCPNGLSNNFGSAKSPHDILQSNSVPPLGESHQAVHNVSEMVTTLSSRTIADVEAMSVTSVFLDECLHMFFERFIPTFPILHRATFVFCEYSQSLILNAMAIGSLYLGPKSSVAKGEALWRLAHVAVMTSWEKLITHKGLYDPCPGVQLVITALLAQAYGALSQNRAIRTTSQAFHALGFYWARQCASYDLSTSFFNLPSLESSEAEKENCWRVWAAKEVRHRVLLGHYLLDGLVSRMTGEPLSVRHSANPLGIPCTEAVFNAQNANDWLSLVRVQHKEQISFRTIIGNLFQSNSSIDQLMNSPSFSAFSFRVVLEGLQSLVSDGSEDAPTFGMPTRSELQKALVQVHWGISKNQNLNTAERLETLLRWHTICLDACVDSSMLCLLVCARYKIVQHVCPTNRASTHEIDLVNWVTTENARRALLHAIAIQEIVEQLPRGRAHVIHIPGSLFTAATIYCVFSLGGLASINIPVVVEWEDLLSDRPNLGNQRVNDSETRRYLNSVGSWGVTKNLLYELNSMQKLFRCLCSQWGIAYDMEEVLDQWNALCH